MRGTTGRLTARSSPLGGDTETRVKEIVTAEPAIEPERVAEVTARLLDVCEAGRRAGSGQEWLAIVSDVDFAFAPWREGDHVELEGLVNREDLERPARGLGGLPHRVWTVACVRRR